MVYLVLMAKDRRLVPERVQASSEAEARALAEDRFPDFFIHSVRPFQ